MLTAEQPTPAPTWTIGRAGLEAGPRVLVVEDSPSDTFLIGRALAVTSLSLRCEFSTSLAEAASLARRGMPDIVLLDLSLSDSYGIGTLKRFRSVCPLPPVVVVTGRSEIRLAVQALRAGACDYVLKTELDTLEPTLRRVLAETAGEREQKRRAASQTRTSNLESVGRLAAAVAHQINTPLQFMNDNLAFLRRAVQLVTPALDGSGAADSAPAPPALGADRTRLSFVVEQMPAAIDEALEGIQRIGRFTAALRAQHDLSPEPRMELHIPRVIEVSLASCRDQLTPGMVVSARVEDALPAIPGHEQALVRAFSNIIDNACEAIARSGKGRGKLEIGVARRGDRVEVRFGDDGPGIAPEHLHSVFDPFFTTKAEIGGAGQGLTLAHHVIVQLHGGELMAYSALGCGTTIVAALPLAVAGHDGNL